LRGLSGSANRPVMTASLHLEKRDAMLELLDRGLVMVHLDPRAEGVIVPEWFKEDPTLRLNIAYGFNLPALDVDEEGLYAVLSFGGQNHGCTIPWPAVFAITLPQEQHDGQVWPESLPKELIETIAAVEAVSEEVEVAERGPQLRVVRADDEGEAPTLKAVPEVETPVAVEAPLAAMEPTSESETPALPAKPTKLRLVTD